MKKTICIVLFAIFTNLSFANEVTKMAKIDILFEKMNAKSIQKSIYLKVDAILNNVGKALKVKPEEKEFVHKFEKNLQNLLDKKASWNRIKKPLKKIYAKQFTEKEIVDIISFYETPTGKKFLKVSPLLNVQTMQINQNLLKSILPDLQKISTQFKKEIIEYRKKKSK